MEINESKLKEILSEQRNEFQHFMGILEEKNSSQFQLMGEQFKGIKETLATVMEDVSVINDDLSIIKTDIQFIKIMSGRDRTLENNYNILFSGKLSDLPRFPQF